MKDYENLYKNLYIKLFNTVTDIITILKEIQDKQMDEFLEFSRDNPEKVLNHFDSVRQADFRNNILK